MGLLTSILLAAMGVGVAAANTNDYAPNQAHTPLYTDLSAEAERVAELRRLQNNAQWLPKRPSDELGPCQWVALCHELGYWDNPTEPVEVFWERVRTWDAESADRQESEQDPQAPTSPSYQTASLLVPESREVPLGGVDPETVG